ncbi:MAG: Asp-tRNA(Asn)/Glu-tRNA(Gln) amidotransferase subunit GatC [Thermoanaerobaculia bacterium]|nr:Asp-tRNA(Asn)/Glu-tRNA(Gln) amidotransferase subunit GatC [Thermoanaerobaculia bacterium]
MALNADEVRRIARLAHLHLAPEEVETFVPQLAQILDYFDQLDRYQGEDEVPDPSLSLEVADEARPSMPRSEFLGNAPESLDAFVLVPQVKTTGDE